MDNPICFLIGHAPCDHEACSCYRNGIEHCGRCGDSRYSGYGEGWTYWEAFGIVGYPVWIIKRFFIDYFYKIKNYIYNKFGHDKGVPF